MRKNLCFKIAMFFFGILLITACDSDSKLETEISEIFVDVEVVRFDMMFADASEADLPYLKETYPMFFPQQFADSVWVNKISDSIQIELNNEVAKAFPLDELPEEELVSLFQHIKYYYPRFDVPLIFTTTSDVDYRTKVIVADSLLILELDTYLGSDHYFYEGISNYITKNMRASMLLSDIATAYTRRYIPVPRERHLLSQMLYFGKELYLKDLWIPKETDANKIGYTEEELQWAKENEAYIWSYFIERELLYSKDTKLPGRFINPAPFSKFELELDNESPGMIARFIGWQIVKSYMDRNDTSLEEMLQLSPEELFKNSKYKPKK